MKSLNSEKATRPTAALATWSSQKVGVDSCRGYAKWDENIIEEN
jgi:hypothetical protein